MLNGTEGVVATELGPTDGRRVGGRSQRLPGCIFGLSYQKQAGNLTYQFCLPRCLNRFRLDSGHGRNRRVASQRLCATCRNTQPSLQPSTCDRIRVHVAGLAYKRLASSQQSPCMSFWRDSSSNIAGYSSAKPQQRILPQFKHKARLQPEVVGPPTLLILDQSGLR